MTAFVGRPVRPSVPPGPRTGTSLSAPVGPQGQFFVGLDWAPQTQAACVLDAAGKTKAAFAIEHTADGIATLIGKLARFGEPADGPVGIERPTGRLVDRLLESGHPVVPVCPNRIKTRRDSEVLSGAKSDAGDAAVIAEYLRPRAHRLRVVPGYSDETKALRTVVRTRDGLVQMRVAATNQLAARLDAFWLGAKAIFVDIESPIALRLLTRYPTAAAARHLVGKRLAAFLVEHGYSSRRPALLIRLRSAPAGTLDDARAAGKDDPHVIRILARAWICGIPYDPAKHGNAAKINQPLAA